MSDKQVFQIFFGEGEIVTGLNGVDLSRFKSLYRGVSRAHERTFYGVRNWLMRVLQVDPEEYKLRVRCLVNRVQHGFYWELVELQGTKNWRDYVQCATERGWPLVLLVETVMTRVPQMDVGEEDRGPDSQDNLENEEENEEENREGEDTIIRNEPNGEADEGERMEHIVEEMRREDLEHHDLSETDSSDEEDGVAVPAEWNDRRFEKLQINEGYSEPWEYHENEVTEGAIYKDKDDVKDAVKYWALSVRRSFVVARSTTKLYDVKCVSSSCPFRVHAYEEKWTKLWKCSIVKDHTCELQELEKCNSGLTSQFVANYMYSRIIENIRYEPKSIINTIEEDFKYTISYSKAWKAKQKVIEQRFGSYEASYDNLPSLLHTIAQRNRGTYFDLMDVPNPRVPGKLVLLRAFFALGQSINAFRYCRPVICIDGTFLTGKYKGQILTAIGVDGNNQVLPLAFAFVESENTDSWYWFLERVKLAVVQTRPGVCVIHDRHAGLLKAILDMKFGCAQRSVPPRWTDIESRWCMRHFGANFFSHFKNKPLMKLFKRLCSQNQQRKFNALWNRLNELTAKHSEEVLGRVNSNPDDAPTPLCGLPTDEGRNIVRKSGSSIRCFEDWIEHEPKEKWALLYDTGGARYGIMTTNLAEVYNWVLRGLRGLPLVAIVEGILHGTCNYFRDRYAKAINALADNRLVYTTFITKYMDDKIKKASLHRARPMGTTENRFEILCRDRGRRGANRERSVQECVLRDDSCSCSCMKPSLLHRPCSHVIAACSVINLSPTIYVSQFFFKEIVVTTWNAEIYGFHLIGTFTKDPGPNYLRGPDTTRLKQKRGRRKTRRLRNDMDESEVGRVEIVCTKCNEIGHSFNKCPNITGRTATEAGPSGNPHDGRRPPGARRARPRAHGTAR